MGLEKIKLKKVGLSAGVGVLDEVANYVDRKQAAAAKEKDPTSTAWTESFRNSTDIYRLAAVGAGLAMTAFDYAPDIGETLYIASIPLLVKSIATPIRSALEIGSGVEGKARGRVLRKTSPLRERGGIAQSEPEVPVVSSGRILA